MLTDWLVRWMQGGQLSTIRSYIETRRTVNDYVYCDDENRLNMLHLAAGLESEHREALIELLIECRADLNYPGKSEGIENVRPLHLAAMWGYDRTVKMLLFHGADVSLRDSNGLSAIDYASLFDNYECISLLLRYGCLNSTASAWSTILDTTWENSEGKDRDDDCSSSAESNQHRNMPLQLDQSRNHRRSILANEHARLHGWL